MTIEKKDAQEKKKKKKKKHIALYVNQFSIDLGKIGKNAIQLLFDKATENGLIEGVAPQIFVD